MNSKQLKSAAGQRGASLIEVLVSMVILMIGLLGLIGVMIESQRAQLESYQRVQALLLAQDMVARINGNRAAAECYRQADALGTGNGGTPAVHGDCTFAAGSPQRVRVEQDLLEWKNLLLGSAERDSSGSNIGAVLGARGCIKKDPATQIFLVSVAWQGQQTLASPPAGLDCGQDQYGTSDTLRRAVGLTVIPPNAS